MLRRFVQAPVLAAGRGAATSARTLYDRLGVAATVSADEIKQAYRRRVLVCHPDVAPPGRKAEAESEFRLVSEAYTTLADEQKRRRYDLAFGIPREASDVAPTVTDAHGAAAQRARASWQAELQRVQQAQARKANRRPPTLRKDADAAFRDAFHGRTLQEVLFEAHFAARHGRRPGEKIGAAPLEDSEAATAAAALNAAARQAAARFATANPHLDPTVDQGFMQRRLQTKPPPSSQMPFRPFVGMKLPPGVTAPPPPEPPTPEELVGEIEEVVGRPMRKDGLARLPGQGGPETANAARKNWHSPDRQGVIWSWQRPY